ncbi:MAG: ABC-2 transporter permease, partial [Firmicutes bacterium]|nr:ABC-2 transporter permease [Bacillota bacterium]
ALMGIMAGDGLTFIISFAMFAGTFTAFNFENTEKSNLNVLFSTLPTNRKSIINARYIYIMVVLGLSLLVAIIGALIIEVAFGNTINGEFLFTFICLSFALYLINTGFQTPFLYAKGYTKGKIFLWIPIIVLMVILNIPVLLDLFNVDSDFNVFNIMFRNTTATSIISIVVGIVSIVTSYFASRWIYLKKDF